ncbi:unnamed protein product, partial [Didymodactylos carnosus]
MFRTCHYEASDKALQYLKRIDIQEFEDIKSELLTNARNCNLISCIIIKNESQYALQYKNHGGYSGFFFTDAIDAFHNEIGALIDGMLIKTIIPKEDAVGGILHTKESDAACGSSGYISLVIATEAKNYIVCCGFNTSYSGRNLAEIEIRAEDGVTDEKCCITGHGIDPTGNVTDINGLITKTYHSAQNDGLHDFYEACRVFK